MADPETRFLGLGKPGRREQPAYESLSSRATLVEVPLTGLSFGRSGTDLAGHRRLIRALETRNAELAASTVLGHIRAGEAEVFAHLAANQAAAVSEEKPRRPIQRRGRPRGSKTKRVVAAVPAARSGRRKPGASRSRGG